MHDRDKTASWIGASLLRKEDARHLHGRGMFIADINMPGTQEIAFVRSQRAHANVRQVTKPSELGARVFTLAEIGQINILEAGPELAAHRHSPYPPTGGSPSSLRRTNHRGLHDAHAGSG